MYLVVYEMRVATLAPQASASLHEPGAKPSLRAARDHGSCRDHGGLSLFSAVRPF